MNIPNQVKTALQCPTCKQYLTPSKSGFACADWSHGGIVSSMLLRSRIHAVLKGNWKPEDLDSEINRIVRWLRAGAQEEIAAEAK